MKFKIGYRVYCSETLVQGEFLGFTRCYARVRSSDGQMHYIPRANVRRISGLSAFRKEVKHGHQTNSD
jgi:hypothetical protein